MKCFKNLLGLALLTFSVQAMALTSGDVINCYDGVSNENYQIKITDVGDEAAYIRITGTNPRFYPQTQVAFGEYYEGSYFAMLSLDGTEEEAIVLPTEIELGQPIFGTYSDRGDSRAITCTLKK